MSAWVPLEANTSQVCQFWRRDYGGNLWGTYAIDFVCALDIVDAAGRSVLPLLEEWSPGDDEGCRALIDDAAVAYVVCAALAAILLLPERVWHDIDENRGVSNRLYFGSVGTVGPAWDDLPGWHGWELWCTRTANRIDHGCQPSRVARHETCSYCNRSRVALYREGALIGWANDDGALCPSDQAAINRAWSMLGPGLRRILAQAIGLPPETIPTVAEIEIHNANEEP